MNFYIPCTTSPLECGTLVPQISPLAPCREPSPYYVLARLATEGCTRSRADMFAPPSMREYSRRRYRLGRGAGGRAPFGVRHLGAANIPARPLACAIALRCYLRPYTNSHRLFYTTHTAARLRRVGCVV